jgi:ABC-type transporter Mla subunit MlaD
MRTERADLWVALSILGIGGLAVAFGFWLTQEEPASYFLYTSYEQVDEMAPGAPVYIYGFQIGSVTEIIPALDPDGRLIFDVTMGIDGRLPGGDTLRVPQGTVAQLSYPPLLGPAFIVLEPPTEAAPPIPAGSDLLGVRSVSPVEMVETLAGQLSFEVVETLARTRQLMDTLSTSLGRVEGSVRRAEGDVRTLVDEVRQQLETTQALARRLETEVQAISPEVQETMNSAQELIGETSQLVDRVDFFLLDNQPEITHMISSLDSATFLLNHLVKSLSENPLRVFSGVPEPPPHTSPLLNEGPAERRDPESPPDTLSPSN